MKCLKCASENPESSIFCGNCGASLTQRRSPSFSETMTFVDYEQDLERGSLFAERYEVIEMLGSGGMGKVYKVYDKKIKEIVALKLIRPELAAKPRTLERFREEIRLARKIIHKNICRMYDLNEAQDTSYITMEYVPGEDLKSMIRMMGRLSPGQAIFIGKQICAGLVEAHKLGIVHRDLKPKNIMVDREGNARIMDFGLARSLEEKGITGGRVMVGTADYMSPEQADGQSADTRSDIYSLGVMLFEMVTGRLLFEGETALSVALKHKTEPPPDPRKVNPDISEALSRLILKCLEKSKEKRYQTAETLLAELNEIEKEFPGDERIFPQKKPSAFRDITRPLGRKKALVPILAILTLAVVAFITWRVLINKDSIPPPPDKPSLAVLRFKDNTGEDSLGHLKQALPDNLIPVLRRFSANLTVLSSDYVLTVLKNMDLENEPAYSSRNLKAIAAEAKVRYILVGSYLRPANKPRIIYELKDARQELQDVGQGIVDSQGREDFLQLTEELAKKILGDLNLPVEARDSKIPTLSDVAYEYYMNGRSSERKYKDNHKDGDLGEALDWYKKAIQKDPGFALAYWGLGDTYQALYVYNKKPEGLERTLTYYEQAYNIDPNLAGSNIGLGWAHYLKGENGIAYQYFKKAYELAPEDPSVNYNIGSFFRSIGLPGKAIKYYSKAIDFGDPIGDPNPRNNSHHLRALCYENMGKIKQAVEDSKKMLDIQPDSLQAKLLYARLLIMAKNFQEAEKEIALVEEASPGMPRTKYTQAFISAYKGEKEKALAQIEGAKKDTYTYTYLLSRVYAILGMKDEAIEIIKLGVERGFQETQDYLYDYPFLANCYYLNPLRNDPRFIQILGQQKKKYDDNMKKYGDL